MGIKNLHIGWWLSGMVLLLCLSCGGKESDVEIPDVKEGPFLEIKVYTPELPKVTRGDIGDTPPEDGEDVINDLSIWVFENHGAGQTGDGNFVGFLNSSNITTESTNSYRITVSETFAETKPNVDIYVVANVAESNTGLKLDRLMKRAELEAAMIEHVGSKDPFGLTTLQTTVPTAGLPMSGVLKNQVVEGLAPIVRVETNVKVARAVSKVRFVFCNSSNADNQQLYINGITLDANMIPTQEYLFLNEPYTGRNYKIGSAYEPQAVLLQTPEQVNYYFAPVEYAYSNQTGQEYEALINDGIEKERLSEVGRFYLRESKKKITGTISYSVGNSENPLTIPFTMTEEGDFSRNHTWIVYGYFAGKDNLKVFSVDVNNWSDQPTGTPEVYNW